MSIQGANLLYNGWAKQEPHLWDKVNMNLFPVAKVITHDKASTLTPPVHSLSSPPSSTNQRTPRSFNHRHPDIIGNDQEVTMSNNTNTTALILYDPGAPPATISSLPVELLTKIVENLDPISSACLGILSKKLYKAHRSVYGSIPLCCPTNVRYQVLGHLLARWVAPHGLLFDLHISSRFITPERLAHLERKAEKEERLRNKELRQRRRIEKYGNGGRQERGEGI
jgi:hypothetical protein